MNNLILLLTYRYLIDSRSQKNIASMTLITFMSIFISTFALALIVSIESGFEKATHDTLQGIHAQIIMQSENNDTLDYAAIKSIIGSEFNDIAAISGCTYKQIIVQKNNTADITNAVLLKAVDAHDEEKTTVINDKIIASTNNTKKLSALLNHQQIIIGKKLAAALHIRVGDTITIVYLPESFNKNQINIQHKKVTVSGIFSTGIEEFDSNLIFASLALIKELFPDDGITHINIKLKPTAHEKQVIQQLKERFHLAVFSWKDLYPALVAALTLEKYALLLILLLIVLIACTNIIALMFMHILQKKSDIAILQALGMKKIAIQKLFITIGMSISAVAAGSGLLCAFIIGLIMQHYPFISLPDSYYTAYVPIHMELSVFIIIFIVILAISFFASWLPCRNIKSMQVAQLLK